MIGVIVMQGLYGTQPDLPLSKPEPEPASASSIRFDSFRLHHFRFTDDFLLLFSDIGSERRAAIVGGFSAHSSWRTCLSLVFTTCRQLIRLKRLCRTAISSYWSDNSSFAMDGVSSAFAVVSLAIQLLETGEKISKFLTSVQDAPSEVSKLCQTVDQLNGTLKQVSYLLEQQCLVLRLPGSPVFITNALENCEKRIKTLEGVILKAKTAMDHKNRVHRSWAAIKFGWKKEDVREMQNQLHEAEAGLRTAMLSNSWQLQYVCQAGNSSIWRLLIVRQNAFH